MMRQVVTYFFDNPRYIVNSHNPLGMVLTALMSARLDLIRPKGGVLLPNGLVIRITPHWKTAPLS